MDTAAIEDFRQYVQKQIKPSVKDLGKLGDKNRVHVQKLVYTNLCDRFDSMVDSLLLSNGRLEPLVEKAMGNLTSQVTEADMVRLLMHGDGMQDAIDLKLQDAIRNSVLRNRHSMKLQALCEAFNFADDFKKKPRVNVSTGTILATFKIQNNKIPHSVCGYADWLYSRRNSVVHGAGRASFLKNDITQIRKYYSVTPTKTFRLKLGSITVASKFYLGIADLLEQAASNS